MQERRGSKFSIDDHILRKASSLTRRVAGKTVTETFPNPTALRKAQQEVTEFHRFQKLSQELVALNEKICRLRPVEQERGGWTAQEKKTLLRSIRKSREK